MHIRAATPSDRRAVDAVVAAAFDEAADGSVVGLVRALDDSGATRASLVAVDDDAPAAEIVGHTQLSRCWLDAQRRLVEVLVLSPVSVVPRRQGQGVGTRLVAAAITEGERLGAPAVFLEGASDYYGARGFSAAAPLGFVAPSVRIPASAFQVALLSGYEPWMTGALVYCEAFWAQDCVGLREA